MTAQHIEYIRVGAYFVVTILLIIFLYSYAISMWRRQKNGNRDYEKYGDLAINDSLSDELVEPRTTSKKE